MLHVGKIEIPLRELRFGFSRSSGPGGQNVNKLNTKVTLHWNVERSPSLPEGVRRRFVARYSRRVSRDGDLVLMSQRFRDQGRNVGDCLEKLRSMIEEVARPPRPRKPTRPGRAAVEGRLREKRMRSTLKRGRRPVRDED